MDLNHKSAETETMNITSPASEVTIQKKTCADCQTTRTPLWRSGPAGPRSLCNACGIRHRKQRRALLGSAKPAGSDKIKKKKPTITITNSNSSSSNSSTEMGVSLNLEMGELGIDFGMQRSWGSSGKKKVKGRKLREEEEAAMLLMALSCGSVFA